MRPNRPLIKNKWTIHFEFKTVLCRNGSETRASFTLRCPMPRMHRETQPPSICCFHPLHTAADMRKSIHTKIISQTAQSENTWIILRCVAELLYHFPCNCVNYVLLEPPPQVEAALIPVTTPSQPVCSVNTRTSTAQRLPLAGWHRSVCPPHPLRPRPPSPASSSVSPASQPRPPPKTLRQRHLWF